MTRTYVLIDREEDAFTVRVTDADGDDSYARAYDNLPDALAKAQSLARANGAASIDTNFGMGNLPVRAA